MSKTLADLRAYAEWAGNPLALTLAADELERLQRLAAEVLAIVERGETPDGDGVGVSVLLWAEGWGRELSVGCCQASGHDDVAAAVAAQRELFRGLVESVRNANAAAQRPGEFGLLTHQQERAWVALIDALSSEINIRSWRIDCRTCRHYTTATGGCISVLRCIDGSSYQQAGVWKLWERSSNV